MADSHPTDDSDQTQQTEQQTNNNNMDSNENKTEEKPLTIGATTLGQNASDEVQSPASNTSTHSPQGTTVINDDNAAAVVAGAEEPLAEEEEEEEVVSPHNLAPLQGDEQKDEEEEKTSAPENEQIMHSNSPKSGNRKLPDEPDIFSDTTSIYDIPESAKKYQLTGSFKENWKEYVAQPVVPHSVLIHDWKAMKCDQNTRQIINFANPAAPRRVYVALKIKRISDIDNVRETYRCRFHVYFDWILTETEYLNYTQYIKNNKDGHRKNEWYPPFIPRYEFLNIVEEHLREEEEYGVEGRYRVQRIKDFDADLLGFDPQNAFFVRVKLEMDATFCEELELESFPVDVQDFSVVIREGWGSHKAIFVPEIRTKPDKKKGKDKGAGAGGEKKNERDKCSDFARVDPSFSVLDEWEFHNSRVEFRSSVPSESRSETQYFLLTIRFKMRRKWAVYFWNVVLYMFFITLMSMSCFALFDPTIAGERMSLAVTLLLTAVAFQDVVTAELPHVAYLTLLHKYIICSFIFISLVAVQTAISAVDFIFEGSDDTRDTFEIVSLAVFSLLFVTYNVYFLFRAAWLRHTESKKLFMDSEELASKVEAEKYQFKMKWESDTKNIKFGAEGHLASFVDEDPLLKDVRAPRKDQNCCQFVFWWVIGGFLHCLKCACCKSEAKRRQENKDMRNSVHEMSIPNDLATLGHTNTKSMDPHNTYGTIQEDEEMEENQEVP